MFALVAALVASGAAGGIAYATGVVGASGSGAVAVCVNKGGAARFVDTGTQCKKGEHAVLLQAAIQPQPTDFTVDCDAGQKIGDVLDQIAAGIAPVTIHVEGTCNEAIGISRDDIHLVAASPGAAVNELDLGGAREIQITGLTMDGPGGLSASNGSTFSADDVHVTGQVRVESGSIGSIGGATIDNGLKLSGGTLDVTGGTIAHGDGSAVNCDGGSLQLNDVLVTDSPGDGVDAWGTCSIQISGGTVQNSASVGVAAWEGASIEVQDGAVIQHNHMHAGALAQSGGSLWISDSIVMGNTDSVGVSGYMGGHVNVSRSTIEDNDWSGISLTGGSSGGIDAATISGNHGNGVEVQDTSVLTGNGGNTITGNHGWGIWCQPTPAIAQISGWNLDGIGTVSGNDAGQVSCPISGQPGP